MTNEEVNKKAEEKHIFDYVKDAVKSVYNWASNINQIEEARMIKHKQEEEDAKVQHNEQQKATDLSSGPNNLNE